VRAPPCHFARQINIWCFSPVLSGERANCSPFGGMISRAIKTETHSLCSASSSEIIAAQTSRRLCWKRERESRAIVHSVMFTFLAAGADLGQTAQRREMRRRCSTIKRKSVFSSKRRGSNKFLFFLAVRAHDCKRSADARGTRDPFCAFPNWAT
jgi:hypothetical protein